MPFVYYVTPSVSPIIWQTGLGLVDLQQSLASGYTEELHQHGKNKDTVVVCDDWMWLC